MNTDINIIQTSRIGGPLMHFEKIIMKLIYKWYNWSDCVQLPYYMEFNSNTGPLLHLMVVDKSGIIAFGLRTRVMDELIKRTFTPFERCRYYHFAIHQLCTLYLLTFLDGIATYQKTDELMATINTLYSAEFPRDDKLMIEGLRRNIEAHARAIISNGMDEVSERMRVYIDKFKPEESEPVKKRLIDMIAKNILI